jgi:F-type H+-transporting ATPase subunit b
MEFDLFTFSAQIVNFIVLVVLLRIFLYKRIIDAMDKREKKIASRLQEAEERESSAREQEEELTAKNRELDENRDDILAKARNEAEERREELLQEAEKEVRDRKEQWLEAVEEDKKDMMREIRDLTTKSLLEVVRRIVNDLAGKELQEQIVHTFLGRLSDISSEERKDLKDSLLENEGNILVRCSFTLDDDQRQMIQKEMERTFEVTVSCSYETPEDMSFGIEIASKSAKVSWTLDSYINSLQDEMNRRLEEEE